MLDTAHEATQGFGVGCTGLATLSVALAVLLPELLQAASSSGSVANATQRRASVDAERPGVVGIARGVERAAEEHDLLCG